MSKYFLRLEAVNLGNFIDDTKDLSTIRGGGLLLLEAVKKVAEKFGKLNPRMTGASVGLYEFDAADPDAAQVMRDEVFRFLSKEDNELKHATFVVDLKEATGNFKRDLECLIAMNRQRQMQSPSVPIDAWNEGSEIGVCELDGVRLAVSERDGQDKKKEQVSMSVFVRSRHGREQKQGFYQQETDKSMSKEFARDFSEIAVPRGGEDFGNLSRKMAVIYLDGNDFGKKKGDTLDSQSQFDDDLKKYRKAMLRKLLDRIETEPDWASKEGRYRFETLLWGGDEIIWVVPAWKGWSVLSFFFEQSKGWKSPGGERLHHGGGLVFCNHKAPIHRITRLARDLAGLAKKKDRGESLFAYEVLESFDHTGDDLQSHRRNRQPIFCGNDGNDPMILRGADMSAIPQFASSIKETVSRRKLHQTIEYLLANDPRVSESERKNWLEKQDNPYKDLIGSLQSKSAKESFEKIKTLLGDEWRAWFHLVTLWDYLLDEPARKGGAK